MTRHIHSRAYPTYLNRFVSPDSIVPDFSNPQSLNRYSYVRNNPVKFQDPSGHAECIDAECEHLANPFTGELIGNKEFVKMNFGSESYIQRKPSPPCPSCAEVTVALATVFDMGSLIFSSIGTAYEVTGAVEGFKGGLAAGAAEGGVGAVPGAMVGSFIGFAVMNAVFYRPFDKIGDSLGIAGGLATAASDFSAGNNYFVQNEKGTALVVAPGTQFATITAVAGTINPIAIVDMAIDVSAVYNDLTSIVEEKLPVTPLTKLLGFEPRRFGLSQP